MENNTNLYYWFALMAILIIVEAFTMSSRLGNIENKLESLSSRIDDIHAEVVPISPEIQELLNTLMETDSKEKATSIDQ